MEITKILIIISVNVTAFTIGLLFGKAARKIKDCLKNRYRCTLTKNADWQTLVNYYPGEPTEHLSSHKKHKGENLWKKRTK